ncbi:MAG: hypothetical protein ACLQVI_40775 [Polyangiaceae bacterium]
MQVKAQGLLNAAKWIEEEYGRDALGEVVRACSEPVRDRYISAIAINWHPVEEFIEFVEKADQILGQGHLRLAEEIGAAGARANMKGTLVRIAFYLAQPEFFFRRVAGLWRQFNDEGQMIVHSLGENSGSMEVSGIAKPNVTFCAVLSGWTRQVGIGLGIEGPVVRHVECRARGDARCMWDVRWSAIEKEEQKAAADQESLSRLRIGRSSPSSQNFPAAAPPSQGAAPPSSRKNTNRPPKPKKEAK